MKITKAHQSLLCKIVGSEAKGDSVMKPTDFLNNYYADLKYQFDMGGIEYVNYNSCGTDEFHDELECIAYMWSLKNAIDLLMQKETA